MECIRFIIRGCKRFIIICWRITCWCILCITFCCTPSKRDDNSEDPIIEAERAAERAERLRKLEEESHRRETEREERKKEHEEVMRKMEEAQREHEEEFQQNLARMEKENARWKNESAKKMRDKEESFNQQINKVQAQYDSEIAENREQTKSLIMKIQEESNRKSEESQLRTQKIEEETSEFLRLGEKRRLEREKEIEELRQKTQIEMEKSRKMWEERKRQLDEQMRFIEMMMARKLWSLKLESYFTNRLNFLRTSNREVTRNYTLLVQVLLIAKRRIAEGNDVSDEFIYPKIQILQKSLKSEKELMMNESQSLLKILENGQWLFLTPVEHAVHSVAVSCENFELITSSINKSNYSNSIDSLKNAHIDLCSRIEAISTFSQIKENYQNFNYHPTNHDMIEDEPSCVQIEEID
ncbi:unnamed protein product [Caenorhabditis angaria]|uniref:Uncharacterized protein n=1 Tax=Caenorhabditis angaria TaxID=860376 RepID=A0A9P1J1P9_9PELO|nr:unnamed protein product [Caenorhabditis angaria]